MHAWSQCMATNARMTRIHADVVAGGGAASVAIKNLSMMTVQDAEEVPHWLDLQQLMFQPTDRGIKDLYLCMYLHEEKKKQDACMNTRTSSPLGDLPMIREATVSL